MWLLQELAQSGLCVPHILLTLTPLPSPRQSGQRAWAARTSTSWRLV